MIIKQISGWQFRWGGDEHTGWLPPGAAKPAPTAVRTAQLNISIEGDSESGFLLIYSSNDGSLAGDNWYKTVRDAELDATRRFGVKARDWLPNQAAG